MCNTKANGRRAMRFCTFYTVCAVWVGYCPRLGSSRTGLDLKDNSRTKFCGLGLDRVVLEHIPGIILPCFDAAFGWLPVKILQQSRRFFLEAERNLQD